MKMASPQRLPIICGIFPLIHKPAAIMQTNGFAAECAVLPASWEMRGWLGMKTLS